MTRSEIWRIEKYLRNLFRLDTISVIERPKQADSVEVHVNGEFIGVIFKDEEDGETSYAFNMAILEMDLPEPPVPVTPRVGVRSLAAAAQSLVLSSAG